MNFVCFIAELCLFVVSEFVCFIAELCLLSVSLFINTQSDFVFSNCVYICVRVLMFSGNWCSLDGQNERLDCTKRFVASYVHCIDGYFCGTRSSLSSSHPPSHFSGG